MRKLFLILALLLGLSACQQGIDTPENFQLSDNVKTVNGVHYLTKTKKTELVCENFTLTHTLLDYTQESIDPETGTVSQVPETQLPRTGGLRHPDKSYYLPKWKIEDYVEITRGERTDRIENLPDRIDTFWVDPSRLYVWSSNKCLPNNEVLISLYSGGNCTNVCQIWAIAGFGENGEILNVKPISYAEHQVLSNDGLNNEVRHKLNIADNVDYKNGR